jgi:hypothetical protein
VQAQLRVAVAFDPACSATIKVRIQRQSG